MPGLSQPLVFQIQPLYSMIGLTIILSTTGLVRERESKVPLLTLAIAKVHQYLIIFIVTNGLKKALIPASCIYDPFKIQLYKEMIGLCLSINR